MDSKVEIFIKRARSEIDSAAILFVTSEDKELKNRFTINEESTFYSGVISHAYYSIFYCAKALLLSKQIETKAPEIHKKTYDSFKEQFVDSGILDVNLLTIYKQIIIRADELLQIFKDEKWKRGHFTYQTIPQANKNPAKESMDNAKLFLKNITAVIEKQEDDKRLKKE